MNPSNVYYNTTAQRTYAVTGTKQVLTTTGSHCWFAENRAVYNAEANKTWIGQVHNSSATGYSQYIFTFDHFSGGVTKFRLGTVNEWDDHNEPSILVRASDKRLIAFYSEHALAPLRYRISTNPLDASAWGSEVTLDPHSPTADRGYTYPTIYQVANGDIYVFYRYTTMAPQAQWAYIKSTDGGATFGAFTIFHNKTYLNSFQLSTNKDIIHFVGSQHPNELDNPNTVCHFYFNAATATFHKSDGTDVTANIPLDDPNMTAIMTLAHPEQGWIEDIMLDSNGYPRVLMTYYPDVPTNDGLSGTQHKYLRYSEWNGTAWSTPYQIHLACNKNMSDNATVLIGTYPPLACFDRGNIDRIFACKEVSGICELFKLTRVSASSFTSEQLTSGSTDDQWRPITTNAPNRNVFWLNKILYNHYLNDYNQELMNGTY